MNSLQKSTTASCGPRNSDRCRGFGGSVSPGAGVRWSRLLLRPPRFPPCRPSPRRSAPTRRRHHGDRTGHRSGECHGSALRGGGGDHLQQRHGDPCRARQPGGYRHRERGRDHLARDVDHVFVGAILLTSARDQLYRHRPCRHELAASPSRCGTRSTRPSPTTRSPRSGSILAGGLDDHPGHQRYQHRLWSDGVRRRPRGKGPKQTGRSRWRKLEGRHR